MATELPAPVGAGVYNAYTGSPAGTAGTAGTALPTIAQLGIQPPRFCAACGRRMVVQVRPTGWTARCSRHGPVDSADLESR